MMIEKLYGENNVTTVKNSGLKLILFSTSQIIGTILNTILSKNN